MTLSVADLIRLVESQSEDAANNLTALGGVEGVAAALNVQLEHGLDSHNEQDLHQRQTQYGKNYIEPEAPKTILQLMWHAFQDLTMMVLAGAGVVSFVIGFIPFSSKDNKRHLGSDPSTAWIEGAAIMFAVLIVVLVAALNDYQKEKQFRALNAVKEDEKIKVIRNGAPAEVSKFNLVVGDIVRVDLGDIIPADGIVFDENDLKLDESAMTGESDLLKKDRRLAPFLLSGTKVMEGVGKMLVVAVGENSQSGIISKLLLGASKKKKKDTTSTQTPEEDGYGLVSTPKEAVAPIDKKLDEEPNDKEGKSPLQGKLDRLTLVVSKIGLSVALFVFVALAIRFCIVKFWINGESWDRAYMEDLMSHFILGVTILVVAIPEGLPLAVTIALAFSVKKMLKDNNLVRHLNACETMGSATTICSDKTGTLTTNRMTVMQCYVGQEEFSVAQSLRLQASSTTKDILTTSICVNSTAEILPPKQVGAQPEHTGNKTECALLQFAADLGVDYTPVRKALPICHMITFSSAKKRMSVVVPLSESKCRIFTKGASEIVLGLCTSQLRLDGSLSPLGSDEYTRVNENIIEKYA
ncbi:hypothetical protein As57867_017846, partial [Aphanomyces stellatus]